MPTPTEELVTTISEKLKASADVKVVYGEPQVIEGKTIIPVAVASYGFGAGAGSGTGPQGEGGHQRGTQRGLHLCPHTRSLQSKPTALIGPPGLSHDAFSTRRAI